MKQLHTRNQRGFTIIELMIAISVLSFVLLLVTVGIIQINKSYYKGIIQANTQQTARIILDEIAQSVQNGSTINDTYLAPASAVSYGPPAYATPFKVNSVCIGQSRYSFAYAMQQIASDPTDSSKNSTKHAVWKDAAAIGCAPVDVGKTTPNASGKDLLGEHLRITNFDITPITSTNLYTVAITVMYGDDDLFDKTVPADPSTWKCAVQGSIFSAAFCARSELSIVVGKRIT